MKSANNDDLLTMEVDQSIDESLDIFLAGPLAEIYDALRDNTNGTKLLIELLLDGQYPPKSTAQFKSQFKQLAPHDRDVFLAYFNLDSQTVEHGLIESLDAIRQLKCHSNSVRSVAHAFWHLDRDELAQALRWLLNPAINYDRYPQQIKETIIERYKLGGQAHLALYIDLLQRGDSLEEQFSDEHLNLLVRTNNLTLALKYERKFERHTAEYNDILRRFLSHCVRYDKLDSINRCNLTELEEEMLNQYKEELLVRGVAPKTPEPISSSSNNVATTKITGDDPRLYSSRLTGTTTPASSIITNATTTTGGIGSSGFASSRTTTPQTTGAIRRHGQSATGATSQSRSGRSKAMRNIPATAERASYMDSPARNTRSARKKKTK